MSYKLLTDLSPAKWIRDGVLPLTGMDNANWKGNFVAHCLPAVFPAYVKLFHPIYEDLKTTDKEKTCDAALDSSCSTRLPDESTRISWKNLAKRYGVTYSATINAESFRKKFGNKGWPKHIWGMAEGDIGAEDCKILIEVLKKHSKTPECYFLYDLIATGEKKHDVFYRGNIDDVLSITNLSACDDIIGTPTYWWPEERSWCVCSDYDLPFTLIGGSEQLIQDLLDTKDLECIRVESTTRIDYKSDEHNYNDSE